MVALAWHFVGATLRDGRPIPADLKWLRHDGPVAICTSGLHASTRLIDALQYAPGSTICRVAIDAVSYEESDKMVARTRAILWRLPCSDDLLRAFGRKAALSVIDFWDAPDIVRQYLETGDESISAAAARAAATARDATAATARFAARAAARAAWAAAAAAYAAAYGAAATARDAAWAARATARDAAWAAALNELSGMLEELVREAAGNPDDTALLAVLTAQGEA